MRRMQGMVQRAECERSGEGGEGEERGRGGGGQEDKRKVAVRMVAEEGQQGGGLGDESGKQQQDTH